LIGFGLVSKEGGKLTAVGAWGNSNSGRYGAGFETVQISESVKELLQRYQPDAVAVEETFLSRNVKTFSSVSQGPGSSDPHCSPVGIKVFEYTPLQVKQAVVGYGKRKGQVQKMD
jgi:crossover junction endodeoxyribonuclease RuvC